MQECVRRMRFALQPAQAVPFAAFQSPGSAPLNTIYSRNVVEMCLTAEDKWQVCVRNQDEPEFDLRLR